MAHGNPRRNARSLVFESLEHKVLLSVSPHEQLAIELVNRARANPVAEVRSNSDLARLNQDISSSQTISASPKQPLAPNGLLQQIGDQHTADMRNRNYYGHEDPNGIGTQQRFDRSPYQQTSGAENLGRETYFHPQQNVRPGSPTNLEQAIRQQHADFFASASHRISILDDAHNEIGVGATQFSGPWNAQNTGNPNRPVRIPSGVRFLLETQVFGSRQDTNILTGVAIDDRDGDHFYDVGEGLANVRVRIHDQHGAFVKQTTTAAAGGYAIELDAGTYLVRATGNGVSHEQLVSIGDQNVKLDFRKGVSPPATPSMVSPGPQTASANRSQLFELRFIDLNPNDSHTAMVDWGDGTSSSANVERNSRVVSVSHSYTTAGNYTAKATITDASGRRDTVQFRVEVMGVNTRPQIDNFLLDARRSGRRSSIRFNVVDPDVGDSHSAAIHFGDGRTVHLTRPNLGTGYGFEAEHTYVAPGSYQLHVMVTDSSGRAQTVDRQIHIRTQTSWNHRNNPADVDRQNGTTPIDALLIIREIELREHSSAANGLITNGTMTPPLWFDVNNNGYIEPVDALLTVNALEVSNTDNVFASLAFTLDLTDDDNDDETRSATN